MFSLEVAGRAAAIATRLQSEYAATKQSPDDTETDEREAEWSVSGLVAEVLAQARLESPPWDRVSADAALSTEAGHGRPVALLQELESRRMVRFVLGEVEIPWGARIMQSADSLDEPERRAISVLTGAEQIERQRSLWIGRETLIEIVRNHARAHPATPPIDQLLTGQLFEARELDGASGFRLKDNWGGSLARGAAFLWHRWLRHQPRGVERTTMLLSWLQRTRGLTHCSDAVAHMPRWAKEAWLDTAMKLVLEEPDLIGWSDEGERLRWELDWPPHAEWEWVPPFDDSSCEQTIVDRYMWLQEFQERYRGLVLRDEARSQVHSLISTIVRHDDQVKMASGERCARIRALVEAGATRPSLLRSVPNFICYMRPSALGWLAANEKTTSLALILMDDVELNGSTWDTGPERLSRIEGRRTELWTELFEVFLIAVRSLDDAALAKMVDECLHAVTERSISLRYHRPQLDETLNTAARVRRDYALQALKEATRSGRHAPKHDIGFQDVFLVRTAPHLLELWRSRSHQPPRPDFATFPFAELHLLFWLLGEIDAAGPLSPWLPSSRSIASQIAAIYLRELVRRGEGSKEVHWPGDEPRITSLAWPLVGHSLDQAEYARFLRPMDWNIRFDEIGSALSGGDALLAVAYRTNRAKLHLRVLLCLHSANASSIDSERTTSLEDAIGELLVLRAPQSVGGGTVELFRGPEWGANSPLGEDLASKFVDELWRFSSDRRLAIVERWTRETESLAELLALAATLDFPREIQIIRARIAEFDVSDYVGRQHRFDRLEQMAMDAAVAKLRDIARSILDYGDQAALNHPYAKKWRRSAFQTRLLLAYEEGELATIDTLVPGPAPDDLPTDEMRKIRLFYRGLLLLRQNPVAAEAAFSELVSQDAHGGPSQLNLMVARMEIVRSLPSVPERRARALAQLDELERLVPVFSSTAMPRWRANVSYCRLDAYDMAEEDGRFDQEWATLGVREKQSVSFLKLLRRNSLRRGNRQAFDSAWQAAQPQFQNVDGSSWAEFERLMTEESVSASTVDPPGVELIARSHREASTSAAEETNVPSPKRPRKAHQFLPGMPWAERETLPGRQQELDRLVDLVLDRRPVALLGQRRSGKTSLLRHLGRRLSAEREVIYVSLDGHRIVDDDDLALALSPANLDDKRGLARRILANPATAKRVYLIDELAYLNTSDQTALGWLRQLWGKAGGVVLAGTPSDWWQLMERSGRVVPGSSFGNDLTREDVGALSKLHAIEFLIGNSGEDKRLDEAAALRIIERCGSWPYYLNVMGEAVLRTDGEIDEQAVDSAYEKALLYGASAIFKARWKELPTLIGNLLLAHPGARPDYYQLDRALRSKLLDVGLCTPAGQWLEDRPFYDWIERFACEEEL